MIRRFIQAIIVIFFSEVTATTIPEFEEHAPASLADHLHLSSSNDPVDGGWLPNLTGLPVNEQVSLLNERVVDLVQNEKDKQCASINSNLRLLIFQHFLIYQYMANAQNTYFDEQTAYQWAHILAMILKESSGDSAGITDMNGHSISTYKAQTNLDQWRLILTLAKQRHIRFNYQTNFGLTQTSADRLFNAFQLGKNKSYDTAFLEGKEGASTPRKIDLNTAIAIRRLIWFYQDFAQGRISQANSRLHQMNISDPHFMDQYQAGLEMAVVYCGTRFMFRESQLKKGLLKKAVASIAYCKLGNPKSGYGFHEIDQECFAQWVTLCPALNIDIALLTPLSYFATRGEKPVCEETFKQLINKNPVAK
ncbi:hypothetical protein [Legionella gresilensis]|uniref:hypothetical protein n=1 Tax=Legionella gresilensis TaxID=91823 RepID=UPI00104127BD|nr:hypothetical protein [Legionella gresilensis]